jgi:uncharacterized membrane protein (TIGR02234 family)
VSQTASLTRTAVAGLAGAGLAAVAAGQTWATATVTSPATRSAVAKGTDVAPLALPLALVALAAWGSVLVLRRTGRRVVAVVGLVASVGSALAVVLAVGDRTAAARDALGTGTGADVSTSVWPFLGLAGAALAAVTFVVAVRRAATWPEMSRRYDAPAAATEGDEKAAAAGPDGPSDRDLWRALDEGRDPTA